MGCNQSLPDAQEFSFVNGPDPKLTPIGVSARVGPSETPIMLIAKEKLFSWPGDDFKIKHYLSHEPFGNGLKIKGKTWSVRNAMALLDGNGDVIAVCMRKFGCVESFNIYTPSPALPGQAPSENKHDEKELYTYCEVKSMSLSYQQEVVKGG